MVSSGPDASNCCLPAAHPVVVSVPPVPSVTRGVRCSLSSGGGGRGGHQLYYATNRLVVCRSLPSITTANDAAAAPTTALVYRGHAAPVSAVGVSPSGAYAASGDERGHFRVWALDHPEHLCKYSASNLLTGPVRDVAWDGEARRIAVAGERAPSDAHGACAKAVQWDTGVTTGSLATHAKGRAASCAFKPNRPLRIATGGADDGRVLFHAGPPFAKVPVVAATDGGGGYVPAENAHGGKSGAVHAVRYNPAGTLVASVGTDRSLCLYDGRTLALVCRVERAHAATIYDVAWSADGATLVTASGDGTCKLFAVQSSGGGGDSSNSNDDNSSSNSTVLVEQCVWKPAEHQAGCALARVPAGGVQAGVTFVRGTSTPVSVGYNGQLSILRPGGTCETVTGHSAPVAACAVDWQAGVFYTGDTDGILCQWDLPTVSPVRRLEPSDNNNADLMYTVHAGAVAGVAVTANGALLSVGWDDKLYVTEGTTAKKGTVSSSLGAQPSTVAAGTNVACIVTVAGLILVVGGTPLPIVSIPYEAQAVAVAADDATVYVGGKDCKIYIYAVRGGGGGDSLTLSHTIDNGHLKPIHCLALSNDGTKLASADERDVCVWDLRSNHDGKYDALVGRGKWCFHGQRVTALAWSPCDTVLASGGADDAIYLWSLARKMTRVHYPYAHRGGLVSLHFLRQTATNKNNDKNRGFMLLSTGVDSVVNLWDVNADVKAKFG